MNQSNLLCVWQLCNQGSTKCVTLPPATQAKGSAAHYCIYCSLSFFTLQNRKNFYLAPWHFVLRCTYLVFHELKWLWRWLQHRLCWNISLHHSEQQQSYSGLRSPGRSYSGLLLKWLLGSNFSQYVPYLPLSPTPRMSLFYSWS